MVCNAVELTFEIWSCNHNLQWAWNLKIFQTLKQNIYNRVYQIVEQYHIIYHTLKLDMSRSDDDAIFHQKFQQHLLA